MKSVTLKSGNTLEIQEADFEKAWDLAQLVAAELAEELPGLKIDSLDVEEILEKDVDVGKIISVILRLVASKRIYNAIWPCFESCLYNGAKVSRVGTFDNPKSRSDFIPCVIELFKVNVLPFIGGLDLSSLKSGQAPKKSDQK